MWRGETILRDWVTERHWRLRAKKDRAHPMDAPGSTPKDCYLERQGVSGQVVKHPELLSGDQPPCGTFTTQ